MRARLPAWLRPSSSPPYHYGTMAKAETELFRGDITEWDEAVWLFGGEVAASKKVRARIWEQKRRKDRDGLEGALKQEMHRMQYNVLVEGEDEEIYEDGCITEWDEVVSHSGGEVAAWRKARANLWNRTKGPLKLWIEAAVEKEIDRMKETLAKVE